MPKKRSRASFLHYKCSAEAGGLSCSFSAFLWDCTWGCGSECLKGNKYKGINATDQLMEPMVNSDTTIPLCS